VTTIIPQTSDLGMGLISTVGDAATIDEELRGVATFASLTLAVLIFFTTRRAQQLNEARTKGLSGLNPEVFGQALLDLLLALATLSTCVAMFSLFTASWSLSDWADREHVSQSMFSIVYLGFGAVFIVQLGLVGGRVIPCAINTIKKKRIGRG
jgi:hypothetical protein